MRKLLLILFIAMTLLFSSSLVFASTSSSFSVKAEIPDNQVDRSKTYFDLKIKPAQKQTVHVEIRNNSKEPIMATVTLNPATTGQNGIILYNVPSSESSKNSVSIMDVARVDTPKIRVEAESVALADITIKMPKESIDGAILGGLVFSTENSGSESTQSNNTGLSLQNEIDYIVALKITQSDTAILPDFKFVGVEPGQDNHRTAIMATIENINSAIVKGMNVEGQIYRANSDKVFRELTLTGAEAAPNSSFPLVFDWKNAKVEAGDYVLKLRVEHKGKEWVFDKAFTISSQQAGNTNQNAVNITSPKINGWIIAVIVVLVLAVLYFVWDKFRRSKRTAE